MAAEFVVDNNDFSHFDNLKGVFLNRIDRNNTHYYTDTKCPKCGGTGNIYYYSHVEGGVCFLCGGSGEHSTQYIVRTREYANKLAEQRLAKARKTAADRNSKWLHSEGFSEAGEAWIVMGNTYLIKEQLKAAGCKWNPTLGWHFDHHVDEFDTAKITIDDEIPAHNEYGELVEKTTLCYYGADGTLFYSEFSAIDYYIKNLKAAWEAAQAPVTEYYGSKGDKVQLTVKLTRTGSYETMYGVTTVYTFEDNEAHCFVWKTGSYQEMEVGQTVTLKGTIKDHTEYKGLKQTELTRCKVVK